MMKQTVSLLIFLLVFLNGCGSSFLNTFDHESMVSVTYFPDDNDTQYATRNMVIDHRGCEGRKICTVIMQGVLLAKGKPTESRTAYRGVLRFRSLSTILRFQDNRQVIFEAGKRNYDLGKFQSTAVSEHGDYIWEDFQIDVNDSILVALAKADTVKGILGSINILVPKEYLRPLCSLVDTTSINK